jgi:hypothetical protein
MEKAVDMADKLGVDKLDDDQQAEIEHEYYADGDEEE